MLNYYKRSSSTQRSGNSFTTDTVVNVWLKARTIPGKDSNTYRKDSCGAEIKLNEYGNRNSMYGWEVDHIVPTKNEKQIPHSKYTKLISLKFQHRDTKLPIKNKELRSLHNGIISSRISPYMALIRSYYHFIYFDLNQIM